jgi:hypothetical protein
MRGLGSWSLLLLIQGAIGGFLLILIVPQLIFLLLARPLPLALRSTLGPF